MSMENGVKRWLVSISERDPSPQDFSTAMSLVSQQHPSITRYVKIEDRKRALVSRLLQYALVHQVVGIPFVEIVINRTPEGKPYLQLNGEGKGSGYRCLKEAYVKALGTGVGYKLNNVEFYHKSWSDICVKVDGNVLKDWNFWLFELQGRHWVAVARGHPRNATENYKKCVKQTHFDNDVYKLAFHLPNPMFVTKTVEELCSLFLGMESNAHIHP